MASSLGSLTNAGSNGAGLESVGGKLFAKGTMKLSQNEVFEGLGFPDTVMHIYTKKFTSPALKDKKEVRIPAAAVSIRVPVLLEVDIANQRYAVCGKETKGLEEFCKEVLTLAKGDVKTTENILRMCTQATLADLAQQIPTKYACDFTHQRPYFYVYQEGGHLKLRVNQPFRVSKELRKSNSEKTLVHAHLLIDFTMDRAYFYPGFSENDD